MIKILVPQYFRRFCSNAAKRLNRYIRSSTSSHTFFLPGLCSQYISNSSNSQQPCWQPCWYNSSTPSSASFIAIEHRCNSNSLQHWCLPCWYRSHTPFLPSSSDDFFFSHICTFKVILPICIGLWFIPFNIIFVQVILLILYSNLNKIQIYGIFLGPHSFQFSTLSWYFQFGKEMCSS